MAVYAIGDLQGAFGPLTRLLEALDFDPSRDRLWLVGDLVNRGPDSLATLRWVHAHRDSITTVLGNHDLHLLARAADPRRTGRDTLQPVLDAPDADELIAWLRQRPLFHHDPELDAALVHAGIPPGWDLETAAREAAEVEQVLRGPHWRDLMAVLYGDHPDRWTPRLSGFNRLRFTINALTRMRFCRPDGSLDMKAKGPPAQGPANRVPWFEHPEARWGDTRVVFGHWSALGLEQRPGLLALDTGCCWGRSLTAARLDAEPVSFTRVPCGRGGT